MIMIVHNNNNVMYTVMQQNPLLMFTSRGRFHCYEYDQFLCGIQHSENICFQYSVSHTYQYFEDILTCDLSLLYTLGNVNDNITMAMLNKH